MKRRSCPEQPRAAQRRSAIGSAWAPCRCPRSGPRGTRGTPSTRRARRARTPGRRTGSASPRGRSCLWSRTRGRRASSQRSVRHSGGSGSGARALRRGGAGSSPPGVRAETAPARCAVAGGAAPAAAARFSQRRARARDGRRPRRGNDDAGRRPRPCAAPGEAAAGRAPGSAGARPVATRTAR